MVEHVVREGQSLLSIAKDYGISAERIWNLSANRPLRAAGRTPEMLNPGDVLTIPDKELRHELVATDRRHRFRCMGRRTRLILRFLEQGEARAGESYRVTVDGTSHSGSLDEQGQLEVAIPVDARTAEVFVGLPDRQERLSLEISHLRPICEPEGIAQRLVNLGFLAASECAESSEKLASAVQRFQDAHGIDSTGRGADEATRCELRAAHGS